jgi:hypothetical protein
MCARRSRRVRHASRGGICALGFKGGPPTPTPPTGEVEAENELWFEPTAR